MTIRADKVQRSSWDRSLLTGRSPVSVHWPDGPGFRVTPSLKLDVTLTSSRCPHDGATACLLTAQETNGDTVT
jgi:hypothetical protein